MKAYLSKQILSIRRSQRGQMAIFVALIFQVLFLFFAMAINIGLVVHDKINLQNSVDLAAFYAAQKQAEVLNVIAHSNYQIRQSWKLLNWRYYVLGTLGMQNPAHPARVSGAPRAENQIWPGVGQTPTVCVSHSVNWLSATADNSCKTTDFKVPNVVIPHVVAPFNPFNLILAAQASRIQQQIANTCDAYAGQNWLFAASIYASYLLDQKSRKEIIRALALNLARSEKEVLDIDGQSIYEGAQKTFLKNLTATNRGDSGDGSGGVLQFEMFNSLEGLDPDKWLPPVDVWFTIQYQELTGSPTDCSTVTKTIDAKPEPRAWQSLTTMYDEKKLEELAQYSIWAQNSPPHSMRMSVGVEKNPWYLAYMGIRAKSKPRQLFFPFGEPVEFSAAAYAQPFGGRIGPWYGRSWSRGASNSEGDQMQLGPQRLLDSGWQNSQDVKAKMPMYSKYPGDVVSLKSFLAQQALIDTDKIKAHIGDYMEITQFGEGQINDALAFDHRGDSKDNVRQYEIAAVAPDLFDITYYSVQPNFGETYLQRLINNRNRFNIPKEAFPRGDLGSRNDPSIPDLKKFSVKDQILSQGQAPNTQNLQALDAFWFVRERQHLLTSWVHNDKYGDYFAFPDNRFGKCKQFDDQLQMKAPGGCLDYGGRTGYSVKIISPEIFKTPLPLGGKGQGDGVILNQPPEG